LSVIGLVDEEIEEGASSGSVAAVTIRQGFAANGEDGKSGRRQQLP
jgi:hypothetical protein